MGWGAYASLLDQVQQLELGAFLSSVLGAGILLDGKQRNKQRSNTTVTSISYITIIGFVVAYYMGTIEYWTMSLGVIHAFTLAGITHKIKKTRNTLDDFTHEYFK